MICVPSKQRARPQARQIFLILLLFFSFVSRNSLVAQTGESSQSETSNQQIETEKSLFRLERTEVSGGAELLTIFGSLNGLPSSNEKSSDVPLVSILRDTLGDNDPENDRLRDVWMLTYTRPTFKQRFASAIPFLYARIVNKKRASKDAPPSVLDLSQPDKDVWRRLMWMALQNIFINPYGAIAKSSTRTLQRNANDYRKAHIIRALAILSLYEAEKNAEPTFSQTELREIQARLMLTQMAFGGIVDDLYLQRVYLNQTTAKHDERGHNWELLRQRAEAEGLYFEPLEMPGNNVTHAMLWVAKSDLDKNRNRKFSKRFLNISNPWDDKRLVQWKGYTETRHYDAENRPVADETPGGRTLEMIPLAIYGLDNPKIPTLLVDFRDGTNPKRREMSRRILEDVTRNVLSISRYGDIHYFLGRTIFDFVTGRRGMDINQPTRLRAYSQLKLLLSLNASLEAELRDEINSRLERVSLNPLENDLEAEARLAREQYKALLDYARRPDGLPAKLARDRRAELVPLAHGGRTERFLFRLTNILSFGLYTHREDSLSTEEQQKDLDRERRLTYHRRFLREVVKSSPLIEIVWNIEDVRRSLRYIAENGSHADAATATAAARIFAQTNDEETQRLSLNCLYRINNETAKKALLRIHQDSTVSASLRDLSAGYLRDAVREEQRIAPSDAKAIVSVIGQ